MRPGVWHCSVNPRTMDCNVLLILMMFFAPNRPVFTFLRPEQSRFLFLHQSVPGSSTQRRNKKEKQVMALKTKRAGAFLGHVHTAGPVHSLRSVLCPPGQGWGVWTAKVKRMTPWRTPALSSSLLSHRNALLDNLGTRSGKKGKPPWATEFHCEERTLWERSKPRWESERPPMPLLESGQGKEEEAEYFLERF